MLLFLQLEQKGHEIDKFYSSVNKKQTDMPKGNSNTKDKDKEKHVPSIKKQQQDASRREAAAQKRMQDLIRHFGTILRQVATFHLYSCFRWCVVVVEYDIFVCLTNVLLTVYLFTHGHVKHYLFWFMMIISYRLCIFVIFSFFPFFVWAFSADNNTMMRSSKSSLHKYFLRRQFFLP
jgi:hypothetical protein